MSNNSNLYPVKFKDLINELARLCDMDYKMDLIGFYVTTSVCYYGKHSLDEMIKLMNNKDFNFRYGNDYLHIIIYGKKNNKYIFFYNFKLRLNCDELQADGKVLKDYMKVKNEGGYCNNLNYSIINIDKNTSNLILYFDNKVLTMDNRTDFFPNELLRVAVDNCYLNCEKKNY